VIRYPWCGIWLPAAGFWLLAAGGWWLVAGGWWQRLYSYWSCSCDYSIWLPRNLVVADTRGKNRKQVTRDELPEWRCLMSEIVSYRDLEVWQSGMELLLSIYELASQLPQVERFGIASQMRRAAVSVPSNVAEGQAYGRGRRYLHHVRVALGSLAELDTQIEAVRRVGYFNEHSLQQAVHLLNQTGRLLHGLERSLKRRQMTMTGLALAACLWIAQALLLS
jgi:four helix bundle protein